MKLFFCSCLTPFRSILQGYVDPLAGLWESPAVSLGDGLLAQNVVLSRYGGDREFLAPSSPSPFDFDRGIGVSGKAQGTPTRSARPGALFFSITRTHISQSGHENHGIFFICFFPPPFFRNHPVFLVFRRVFFGFSGSHLFYACGRLLYGAAPDPRKPGGAAPGPGAGPAGIPGDRCVVAFLLGRSGKKKKKKKKKTTAVLEGLRAAGSISEARF